MPHPPPSPIYLLIYFFTGKWAAVQCTHSTQLLLALLYLLVEFLDRILTLIYLGLTSHKLTQL